MGTIKSLHENLPNIVSEINTGLNRKKPPTKTFLYDEGILALPTFAPAPPENIYQKLLRSPSTAYVLNCGGTNWEAVEVRVGPKTTTIQPQKSTMTFTSPNSRVFDSLDHFAEKIADLLYNLIRKRNFEIESITVVLGFPLQTIKTRYGVDAQFLENQLPKKWYIGGKVEGVSIGTKIKTDLNKKYGISARNIVFGNDAALMMWDVSTEKDPDEEIAHIGGVWGSGTNLGITRTKGKENPFIINTEIGRSRALLTSKDLSIFEKMAKLGCFLPEEPELEVFVGGDYIFYRFATRVLDELTKRKLPSDKLENRLKDLMKTKGNSEIVSNIRKTPTLNQITKSLRLEDENSLAAVADIITDSAEKTLSNTEDKIALMIAGCIIATQLSPGRKWIIPAEGSVLLYGEQILTNVNQSLKQLLPDHSIKIDPECSGKKAMALFSEYLRQTTTN